MQLGFYFDQTRCTGCYACAVACKDWNDIPAGLAHWRRIVCLEEGEESDLFVAYLSTSCHHCAEPLCAVVCPAHAISKREEDGIVLVDREKCRQAAPCGIIPQHGDLPFGEVKSPCNAACPAGVNVHGYVGLIAQGKFREALELIRRDLPLPSICGRACTHPCESACARQKVDEPIAIMELKRFVADQESPPPHPFPVTKRQKVAVVGSGPAGLSAAWSLAKRGYPVTVFEALPVAGGMLAVGLPEYRVPKEILRRDLDNITALGIEIRTDSPLGDHLTIDDLKDQGYEAVFLSIGAHKGHAPPIDGIDLEGVHIGVSFLKDVNLGKKPSVGERVLVLGGGRVALDCARAAYRLGASEVRIACVENRDAMRAEASEIREAEEEGVIIQNGRLTESILGKEGRVRSATCLDVRSFYFDESGRLHAQTDPTCAHVHEVDTVIFSIGQSSDLEGCHGIRISGSGTISTDRATMATNLPGVFAGGEAASGPTSIVEAVAAGKRAAASMDAYLQGLVFREPPPLARVEASDMVVEIPSGLATQPRQRPVMLAPSERKSWHEVSRGFSEADAITEAKRCLNCAGHLCREVCPYHAPQFGSDQNPRMEKCNLCVDRWSQNKNPICVDACPTRAMDAGPLDELMAKYGGAREAEGFVYCGSTNPSICFKPKKYQPSSHGARSEDSEK